MMYSHYSSSPLLSLFHSNDRNLNSVEFFRYSSSAPIIISSVCLGSPPTASAVCENGQWIIPDGYVGSSLDDFFDHLKDFPFLHRGIISIIITPGQEVTINGTVILFPDAITIITVNGTSGPPINVSGSLTLDGILTIFLGGPAINGSVIPLINGTGEVNGSFASINVSSPERCQQVSGTPIEARGTYGVLLSVDDSCATSDKSLTTSQIAGIIVGGVLFLALLLVIALLLLWRWNNGIFRKKRVPRVTRAEMDVYS